MKIIIAGSGDMGFHLAELLSIENQDITLIDNDDEVLTYAANHLDVMTVKGDAASIDILEEVGVKGSDLFLSVTTSESTNLLSAILAKKMGARQTVARVNNPEYLQAKQRADFKGFGVDTLISPTELAAEEIKRLLKRCSFTDVFEFEQGKISVIGFTVDNSSSFSGKTLDEINNVSKGIFSRAIAILRNEKTIIPSGGTRVLPSDHLYLVTNNNHLDSLTKYVGKTLKKVKRIMIIGGKELGLRTAQKLEQAYKITIVEKDKKACKKLVEKLHDTLIVHGDPSNIDFLKEEGLENMDAFIALTPNSEINILTSLMAEELGVYKTIALVDNHIYTHISQNIGVDTIINKKLIAANNIFRFVRKGKVEAITSLHGVDAEIIEFVVHKNNRLTKLSLRELHLPEHSIIAGVVRGEISYIPTGDFRLELDDKVIVFAQSDAIPRMEEIFR